MRQQEKGKEFKLYRVSPLLGRPYDSRTSSRTGLSRFHAPDAPRRLLGRIGSEDFIFGREVTRDTRSDIVKAGIEPHGVVQLTHYMDGKGDA